MNQHRNQTDPHKSATFEDRLLAQLRATVAERGAAAAAEEAPSGSRAWRRPPRLALAGAAVATVAVATLVVSAGGDDTTAAYAVEPQADGMVSVEIRSLSDSRGLEQALDAAGVPASVNYLPAGEVCEAAKFKPTGEEPADAATGGEAGPTLSTVEVGKDGGTEFTISRNAVGPDQTLVLTASPGPGGEGSSIQMTVAEGEVGPCEPTAAPAGTLPAEPAPGAAATTTRGVGGPTTHGADDGATTHGAP